MAQENEQQAGGQLSTEQRRQMRHESHAAATYKAFIKDMCELGGYELEFAERAAICVLEILEERLFGTEVKDLEAQLPSKLRDELQKGERHDGKPTHKFGRDELMERVARELQIDRDKVEPVVRSVFAAVRSHITEGEAEDVAAQLPQDLAVLWRLPA